MAENPRSALDEPLLPRIRDTLATVASPPYTDAPTAPENAATSLDRALQQKTRCQGTNKDGSPCATTRGLRNGLCSTHSGAIDHAAAARARGAAVAARRDDSRAAVQHEAERSKLGLRAALAVALAERQEEIVAALIARAVDDGDTGLLLRLFTEALGKPGEAAPPVEQEPEATLEDIVAAWRASAAAGDAGT